MTAMVAELDVAIEPEIETRSALCQCVLELTATLVESTD